MQFEIDSPTGWEFYADEDEQGGSWIPPCRGGVLHIHSEPVTDVSKTPALSRLLANFVTLHHQPVATDELLRWKIPGCLCYAWQYAEQGQAVRLWMIGNESHWAFATFQAPLEAEPQLRQCVDEMISNFRFR